MIILMMMLEKKKKKWTDSMDLSPNLALTAADQK